MAKVPVHTYNKMPHESFRHSVSVNDNNSEFSNTSNLTARRFNSHRQSHQKQHDTSQRNPYIVR